MKKQNLRVVVFVANTSKACFVSDKEGSSKLSLPFVVSLSPHAGQKFANQSGFRFKYIVEKCP